MNIPSPYQRLHILAGDKGIAALKDSRVIVFGVGGVGSWCAEALVRSGIYDCTLVDSDLICATNINRQVQALPATVGKVKVTELAERLSAVNPDAVITPLQKTFDRSTSETFDLSVFDYIIDAIDSLSSKVELMIRATDSGATLYSALGASGKLNPRNIKISSIWETQKCRLGRFVRKRLRRRGFSGDFTCVYSDEEPIQQYNTTPNSENEEHFSLLEDEEESENGLVNEGSGSKKQINGSVVHMAGSFGFILAGLVVEDIINKANETAGKP